MGGQLLKKNGKYVLNVEGAEIVLSEDKQKNLAAKNIEEMYVTAGARPEHITLDNVDGAMLEGTVEVSEMMGSSVHLHLNAYGRDCIIIVPTLDLEDGTAFEIGSTVKFTFAPNAVHLFDPETGRNLEF